MSRIEGLSSIEFRDQNSPYPTPQERLLRLEKARFNIDLAGQFIRDPDNFAMYQSGTELSDAVNVYLMDHEFTIEPDAPVEQIAAAARTYADRRKLLCPPFDYLAVGALWKSIENNSTMDPEQKKNTHLDIISTLPNRKEQNKHKYLIAMSRAEALLYSDDLSVHEAARILNYQTAPIVHIADKLQLPVRTVGYRDQNQGMPAESSHINLHDYFWIGDMIAQRYKGKGEPYDDIRQVALYGVLSAFNRFDATKGDFRSFAVSTAFGEVKRHFRDHAWGAHVDRRTKETVEKVRQTEEALVARHGRNPSDQEIVDETYLTRKELDESRVAVGAYALNYIDLNSSDLETDTQIERNIADPRSADDIATKENRMALAEMLATLPDRERRILYLSFYEDMTQTEIAQVIGVSQVHVSRLIQNSLTKLKSQFSID